MPAHCLVSIEIECLSAISKLAKRKAFLVVLVIKAGLAVFLGGLNCIAEWVTLKVAFLQQGM